MDCEALEPGEHRWCSECGEDGKLVDLQRAAILIEWHALLRGQTSATISALHPNESGSCKQCQSIENNQ